MKNMRRYRNRPRRYNRLGMSRAAVKKYYPSYNYGRVPRVWSAGYANSMP